MPRTVRRAGEIIVGAEPVLHQHGAGGGVDILAGASDLNGGEGGGLRLLLDVPDVTMLGRRFAENVGAGDVGLVALDVATGVHEDEFALLQRLLAGNAVRIGRGMAELDD